MWHINICMQLHCTHMHSVCWLSHWVGVDIPIHNKELYASQSQPCVHVDWTGGEKGERLFLSNTLWQFCCVNGVLMISWTHYNVFFFLPWTWTKYEQHIMVEGSRGKKHHLFRLCSDFNMYIVGQVWLKLRNSCLFGLTQWFKTVCADVCENESIVCVDAKPSAVQLGPLTAWVKAPATWYKHH